MDTIELVFQKAWSMEHPVIFFPIRHHSPICTYHLLKAIEEYQPEAILIEGPSDTNQLLPVVAADDTETPVCIYYSVVAKDNNEEGGETERRTACYYPLLDFSPELSAIRKGYEKELPVRFIDLPYSQQFRLERKESEEGKNSYYDDYYLSRSRFIESLCEKTGCRHYAELWERLFEIGGLFMDTGLFVKSMLALCHYSRVEYPAQLLQEEGCLDREAHMAQNIRAAQTEFGKILVITGGFHTAALMELLDGEIPKVNLAAGKASSYLIPYSMAESDQLAGYSSGMPYPAFYQKVHENLRQSPDTAYDDAVLSFLVKTGNLLRKKKESISIADEAAALTQSKGLAQIRDKQQQGVYELLDAVRSAYIKGEAGGHGQSIVHTAETLLRGDKLGKVSSKAEQIPLLLDFQAMAAKYRLKISAVTRQEITLDILTKPAHREASAFFHQLAFMNVGFGEMEFGPKYRNRDTSRVREKWRYSSSARVLSALVDVSYLGGTVREAASTMLARKKQDYVGCGEYSRLIVDAAVMGLSEHIKPLLASARDAVAQDGSFASLAEAAVNLLFLENAKWLLNLPDSAMPADLLRDIYNKAVSLLPYLQTNVEEEDRELAKLIKEFYQISRRPDIDASLLDEALLETVRQASPPPCFHGSSVGLLYAVGLMSAVQAVESAKSYLLGSGEMVKKSGLFLSGLFLSAWDILFNNPDFLDSLSQLLRSLGQEEFLSLIPDLRLAFSIFTPTQIDRIGELVAEQLGISPQAVSADAVPEQVLALCRQLDQYAMSAISGKEEAS